MAAAVELFSRKGYDGTPVREIVEAAGVTKPVLYYYFKSKDNLLATIVGEAMDGFHDRLRQVCAGPVGDLAARLDEIKDLYLAMAREQPLLVRFLYSIAYSGQYEHLYDFLGAFKREMQTIVDVFERAGAENLVRDDIRISGLAHAFIGVLTHWMQGLVYCPELVTDPEGVNIVPVVLDGVRSRPERTDRPNCAEEPAS